MSFSSSIPNVGDFLALSQKQMNANFQDINNSFSNDHVAYTAVENEGMHDVLTMRPQVSDPTTSSTQCALYNKLVSSIPQLFFRSNSNATPIQLTNSNLNTIQTGAPGGSQSSFLAGPFTIYMGYVLNCPNPQIVSLTPATTLIYVGLSTYLPKDNQGGTQSLNTAVATNITANQFTINYSNTILLNPPPPPTDPRPIVYYTAVGV